MRSLWCVVLVLAATQPALAERALVVVEAETGLYEDPVRTRAEGQLKDADYDIRPFGEAVVEAGVNPTEVVRCLDKSPACMASSAAPADVDRVLIVRITGTNLDGQNRVVVNADLFDGRRGDRLHTAQRYCEPCTSIERLVELSAEATGEVIVADTATTTEAPAGATLEPAASPATEIADDRRDFHDALKWGCLGAGALSTVVGVAWIAVDGPQSSVDPETQVRVRERDERRTFVPGVIATAAGVGLLGASAYLFYRDMNAPSQEALRASAFATGDGAFVSFSGSFR